METKQELANAWADGFNDGASQLYKDVDKILKEAVAGPHWGALMATGVLHKIIELKAFYKVDGRRDTDD